MAFLRTNIPYGIRKENFLFNILSFTKHWNPISGKQMDILSKFQLSGKNDYAEWSEKNSVTRLVSGVKKVLASW